MNRPFRFALLLALAGSLATPALAERDHDRGRNDKHQEYRKHRHAKHDKHEKHRKHARHDERRRDDRRESWREDQQSDWQGDWRDDRQGGWRDGWRDCPPGLVEIGRDCVPRGQLRKRERERHYYPRVGEVLPRDYRYVSDPWRYQLEQRDDWDYYRDDNQIYRVDSGTRKVLAVLELIQAFAN